MAPPANVGTWPMQASYAASGDWQGLDEVQQERLRDRQQGQRGQGQAGEEAKAAPPDDLTQLTRHRPTDLIDPGRWWRDHLRKLEHTDRPSLRKISRPVERCRHPSPDTWPTQASYAVRGDWSGLSTYNHK